MNLGCQLITYKRITTTLAKAKALRTYIEPLITKTKATESKESIMHNHRIVFSYLNDKQAVKELFTVVAPKVVGRPGGYTRIIKLGARIGDNAELAMIELVHQLKFEHVIFVGKDFYACKKYEFQFFETTEEAKNYLSQNKPASSMILVKGSRGMKLELLTSELNG